MPASFASTQLQSQPTGLGIPHDSFRSEISLTDRGTEYCGNPEHHEYELYLALANPLTQPFARNPDRAQLNFGCRRIIRNLLRSGFCRRDRHGYECGPASASALARFSCLRLPAPFEHHPTAYTMAFRHLGHTQLVAFFNDRGFFVFAPTPPVADALRLPGTSLAFLATGARLTV
jgi:hypothetical protein